MSRKRNEYVMYMLGHEMQGIYELLALIVALYFPVSLLAWLVIDKFLAAGDGDGRVVQHQPGKGVRDRIFSGRPGPGV
ncbi:MAG TPA: hypothetical protein VFL79_05095 [Terriglobia bacterium]|nr:hypothetical protein [Terriglobia bacterium]